MQVNLETFARNALRRAADYRYHRQHGMQANNIVKTLERKFGQTNPAEIKLADAYAQEVLGDVLYAPLASCVHSASWELQRRVRFAAKVLCDNLQTLTTLGAHASANLPASRRINRTYVHTVLKPLLPALLLGTDVANLLHDALTLVARHTYLHREGLSKPRKPRQKPHKFMAQKPC